MRNKGTKWSVLLSLFCVSLSAGISVKAQVTVLDPITINVDNTAYAYTRGTGQSEIRNINSSVPTVASAREWGTNDVQITGKRPGKTVITFNDRSSGRSYQVSVTVNPRPSTPRPNPTPTPPGGNQGSNNQGGGNPVAGNNTGGIPGYIRPIEVKSKQPEEPPIRTNTSRGYNLVYKNKYGEVVQIKEFDRGGKLVHTKEIGMAYPDGKPASVVIEKPNGDFEEVTYDIDRNVITREVYTDIKDGKATKKEVLENGVMKKYYQDANGDWQPVGGGNQPPQQPGPNQPPKPGPNQPPKQNEGPAEIGYKCLAGTWRSILVTSGVYTSGGDGIVLTIKATGLASIDFNTMNALKADSPMGVLATRKFSGVGTATIRLEGQKLTSTPTGTPSIRVKTTGEGAMEAGPFSGLGPMLVSGGSLKYICKGDTLTLEPFEVDRFNFVRVK